jgi:phosphoribosylformimino-5-aminoimidazole carboxamide ribotide isomerase
MMLEIKKEPQEPYQPGKGEFIIPAIDIIEGKCVRLTKGDYSEKKIYNENPLEVAMKFEDAGFSRVHLVDLDGAKEGRVKNWKVLESIAGKTGLMVDFGGGLKSESDVRIVFDSGAKWATVGSIVVDNEPEFEKLLLIFGAEKIIVGADVKNEKIAIKGWQEVTDISVMDLITKCEGWGIQQVFCTDVSKDGMLEGPSIELYESIISGFPDLYFIASGGVSNLKDVDDLFRIGCSSIIIGKAIYEGRISLKDLSIINLENR